MAIKDLDVQQLGARASAEFLLYSEQSYVGILCGRRQSNRLLKWSYGQDGGSLIARLDDSQTWVEAWEISQTERRTKELSIFLESPEPIAVAFLDFDAPASAMQARTRRGQMRIQTKEDGEIFIEIGNRQEPYDANRDVRSFVITPDFREPFITGWYRLGN